MTETQLLIVGIDPSLAQTAMVIGTSPTDFLVTLHKTKPLGDRVSDRVERYAEQVHSLVAALDAYAERREAGSIRLRIFLEGYAFGCKHTERLCEFGGLLRWHLVDHDPELVEVAPGSLKKFVAGKGSAPKDMMLMHCLKQWGYEAQGNDDADAYGLFRLGLCACGLDEPRNNAQREVIEKLQGD